MRALALSVVALSLVSACSTTPTADGGVDAGPATEDGGPGDGGAADAADMADMRVPLPPFCDPPPALPAEALRKRNDGQMPWLLPDNRAITPAGTEVEVGGFPVEAHVHPTLPVVYVTNTGYTDAHRSIVVMNLTTGAEIQEVVRTDAFFGLVINPAGTILYASGGYSGKVESYDISATDGRLSPRGSVTLPGDQGGYPAGLALSADGSRLYAAQFELTLMDGGAVEIDTATMTVLRTVSTTSARGYGAALLPSRNELWLSAFAGRTAVIIDLTTFTVAAQVDVGSSPVGITFNADGSRAFLAISDGDVVVAVDTATRRVVDTQAVGEPSLAGMNGMPLPASSPSGLWFDGPRNRLYVVRANDNAVSVLDPATLEPRGAIPTGWYPTSVTVSADGNRMVITNGKGRGAGPSTNSDGNGGKQRMNGTVSFVDAMSVDIVEGARQVAANVRRPGNYYATWNCDGAFPVPSRPGGRTPIEHVVLIVKENKTYDSVLGDLGVAEADADPSLAIYGETITPNTHALARRFTNSDNFYDDGETSIQGHLWLTSLLVTDYVERTWLEDYRGRPGFAADAVTEMGFPDYGTFFTHLMRFGIDARIYGEITGTSSSYNGRFAMELVDTRYPGLFYSLTVPDEMKARYVASQIRAGRLKPFTYLLMPRDHTGGAGLAPESMIADNDYAVGLVVEAISNSPFWERTAIFILQDDTQDGADHIDYHRSLLLIVSPWAKRGHTMHVHASYPAVFRTMELILGLPPMNRYDAQATPLYDAFTTTPDLRPYTALPRQTPDRPNSARLPIDIEAGMDFRGPDRNPNLGALRWYQARGAGVPDHVSASWNMQEFLASAGLAEGAEETAEELAAEAREDALESANFDAELRAFARYAAQHPELEIDATGRAMLDRALRGDTDPTP
ncbi:MAG: hypothetical protein SFX73_17070 [Kofleriaceae bacterium]|nr:hypothetical protein [Kofleriaceae bacterium]